MNDSGRTDLDTYELVEKLGRFIESDKFKDIEKKPVEYLSFDEGSEEQMRRNEDNDTIIKKIKRRDKEDAIIVDNIMMHFFDLPDDKFILCMQKMDSWGFNILFREFITKYYFIFIKDNRLRFYILKNLERLIELMKDRFERSVLDACGRFNFDSKIVDQQINLIKNDIKVKEGLMAAMLQPKAYKDDTPPAEEEEKSLDGSSKRDIRLAVFARLRKENPGLLD